MSPIYLIDIGIFNDLALPLFLVVIGLALIFLEVYVPSAGLMGFLSALSFGASIWIAFRVGDEQEASWLGWVFVLCVLFLVPLALTFAFKTLPHTPMGKRLILDGAPPPGAAQSSGDDLTRLKGQRGKATTDLRPAGRAIIGGEHHDVSSEGAFITAETPISVHRVEGNRIFVRPDTSDPGGVAASMPKTGNA